MQSEGVASVEGHGPDVIALNSDPSPTDQSCELSLEGVQRVVSKLQLIQRVFGSFQLLHHSLRFDRSHLGFLCPRERLLALRTRKENGPTRGVVADLF